MVADGLAEFAAPGLRVLPAGRLLLRHLGMAFDAYLPSAQASGQRFSKAI
jgi:oxygen-independent coproporphyrinogen-3 oxidase